MTKAQRIAHTDHQNLKLKNWWSRLQSTRKQPMTKERQIEILARMWVECDPNRGGTDPDEIMPARLLSGGTGAPSTEIDNPLGGQPRWKWFVPRAEATLAYLAKHGLEIRSR